MINDNFTIPKIVEFWANKLPNAIAISAPDRSPLTYENLHNHIKRISRDLANRGIKRNDRVAVVIPNGPELATTFLTIASASTFAPLRLNYREEEFNFFFSDLKAKALIIQSGLESPAIVAAEKNG